MPDSKTPVRLPSIHHILDVVDTEQSTYSQIFGNAYAHGRDITRLHSPILPRRLGSCVYAMPSIENTQVCPRPAAITKMATGVVDTATPRHKNSASEKKKQNRRSNLPKNIVDILNDWLRDHYENPYPSPQEKKQLLKQTGLNPVQLSNWFINVRRRKIFQNYYELSKNYSRNESGNRDEQSSDLEFDRQLRVGPLTKRKKLIDRLEELKSLSGTNV
ncbi:HER043Wp [Eremothecium sinecaudum]|uniref:HER043Wp n=1 Tax=Eremothecium sinecaudum TaxID=45286 RepID=A0A0X8HTP3_9SACH|nr:HER043Wp [Eremothecium sinecaudum]AMD21322.1 HER043Wp [Eremothecium sinecaudum]